MSNKAGSLTIIQLTRFGDLLQTIWAVKGIRESNPEIKINLIARKRFSKPLSFLLNDLFDNIEHLEGKTLEGNDLTEGLDLLLDRINNWGSNVVVNLSFSKSSAYLTSLISTDFKLGLTIDEYGGNSLNGSWSEYVYSTVMRGPLNAFSLIDIFRFILGVKERTMLPERNFSGNEFVVHPFASQKRKSWSPIKWSEIIFKAVKNNPSLVVTIVGSKEDLVNGKAILSNPILSPYYKRINLECGTLNFEELYKKLESAFLFCGHDSMVGHLASLAGTQCLTLALGNVRPIETSPYGINNYVLSPKTPCFPCFPDEKCDDYKCHKDLSYQLVSECIQQLIDTSEVSLEEIKKNTSPLHLSTADLYQSGFTAKGLFQLSNISSSQLEGHDLHKYFYKIVWMFLLEDIEDISTYPSLNKSSVNNLESLIPNLKQLFELAEFGKKYSRFILEEVSKKEPNLEYIKDCGLRIEEIDKLQILLGQSAPVLNPIIDFYNLKKAKMHGNNLIELCTSSHEIYQSIGSFCDIMYDLIEKSINEYRILNKTDSMKEAKE